MKTNHVNTIDAAKASYERKNNSELFCKTAINRSLIREAQNGLGQFARGAGYNSF